MKFVRRVILLIVVAAIVLRVAGVELDSSLLWVAAAAEGCIVLLVIYGIIRVVRARAFAKGDDAGPRGWDALRSVLRESLPEGVTEAVLSEARVVVAALLSVTRRPLHPVADKPGYRRFGAMETSSYRNTVIMLMVLIALEAPAVHYILGAVMEEGTLRDVIRGVLLGSSIYLAIWLLGDYRLLRESPGLLVGKDALEVELGLRAKGRVLMDNLAGVQLLPAEGQDGLHTMRISPQPQPNCRIRLNSKVTLRGLVGVPIEANALDLYLDDPSGLVSHIEGLLAHRVEEAQVRTADSI